MPVARAEHDSFQKEFDSLRECFDRISDLCGADIDPRFQSSFDEIEILATQSLLLAASTISDLIAETGSRQSSKVNPVFGIQAELVSQSMDFTMPSVLSVIQPLHSGYGTQATPSLYPFGYVPGTPGTAVPPGYPSVV